MREQRLLTQRHVYRRSRNVPSIKRSYMYAIQIAIVVTFLPFFVKYLSLVVIIWVSCLIKFLNSCIAFCANLPITLLLFLDLVVYSVNCYCFVCIWCKHVANACCCIVKTCKALLAPFRLAVWLTKWLSAEIANFKN